MKNLFNTNPLIKDIKTIGFLIIAGVICFSCDNNVVFEKNLTVLNGSWSMKEQHCFDVEITDTLSLTNFYINIRHTTNYKYSNIYMFLNIEYPDGNSTLDTLELTLADIDGRWFGKGMGEILENRILINRNVIFPYTGNYKFCFEQAMREDVLEEIEDIGIRIEKM